MSEWFRVVRNDAERVDIDVYGDIGDPGWWEDPDETTTMSAKRFLDLVRDAKGKAIDLHVNSGGGSVFDAFAMMTALSAHDGKVTAHIDGIAASAASFLVAAADEVRMSSAAFMMVHDASTIAWGDADEMRATAEWLDTVDAQLAGIYAKRSGRPAEDFRAAMDATTWFTADEAVEWGLADSVFEAVAAAACVTADRRALDTAPEGANIAAQATGRPVTRETPETAPKPVDNACEGESGGQEAAAVAQERAVLVDGRIYAIR